MAKRSSFFLMTLALTACASRADTTRSISGDWFNCEDGLAFSTQRAGGQMLIVMSDGRRFNLSPAPTSIGELFRSSDTTLRIDEDFAVLAGGPAQSYTRCRQMGRGA
jgi:hypothetical protein